MAYENTLTNFAERVHRGVLQQDRGGATRDWHALLQTRHKEHLRIARAFQRAQLQGLLHELFQGLFQGLSEAVSQGLLQGFLGTSAMQFCLADAPIPADSPSKPILLQPLTLMRKAFDKGRDALQGTRRPALPDGSLEKAVSDILDDFSPTNSTSLRMIILGESSPLPPEVHEQVYWIAREALTNALRHSAASRFEVEIEYWERKLRLVVRDNGAGIDPKTLRTGRNSSRGLTSMRDRAAAIGAKLRVSSKQGGGTEVEISLPLPGKPA